MPDPLRVVVLVPGLRLKTGLNVREHWAKRARRVAAEKAAVRLALAPLGRDVRCALYAAGKVRVRMVRLGGRKVDSDNLSGALKSVRDQLALWVGKDDGDEGPGGFWEWVADQEPGGAAGVRLELVAAGAADMFAGVTEG